MPLRFTKLHGLGNDYIYICTYDQTVADPAELARRISDRHLGAGSDGLILVAPPEVPGAHVRMIMYNADGSRSGMCGNGIRCVAKYAYERSLARANPMHIQTDGGVCTLDLTILDQRVVEARVDMGVPVLDPRRIPVALRGDRVVQQSLAIEGITLAMTCVSMGNPHAVFFAPPLADVPLTKWGPQIERHPLFPERVNVHFAQVARPDFVGMITWERGTGVTRACGSGACAVCVAGVLNGLCERRVVCKLPGGELRVHWDEGTDHVFMTGPAEEVYDGVWPD